MNYMKKGSSDQIIIVLSFLIILMSIFVIVTNYPTITGLSTFGKPVEEKNLGTPVEEKSCETPVTENDFGTPVEEFGTQIIACDTFATNIEWNNDLGALPGGTPFETNTVDNAVFNHVLDEIAAINEVVVVTNVPGEDPLTTVQNTGTESTRFTITQNTAPHASTHSLDISLIAPGSDVTFGVYTFPAGWPGAPDDFFPSITPGSNALSFVPIYKGTNGMVSKFSGDPHTITIVDSLGFPLGGFDNDIVFGMRLSMFSPLTLTGYGNDFLLEANAIDLLDPTVGITPSLPFVLGDAIYPFSFTVFDASGFGVPAGEFHLLVPLEWTITSMDVDGNPDSFCIFSDNFGGCLLNPIGGDAGAPVVNALVDIKCANYGLTGMVDSGIGYWTDAITSENFNAGSSEPFKELCI